LIPATRDLDLNTVNDATVQVAINGIKKQVGVDWDLTNLDGSSIPSVLVYGSLLTENDLITISVLNKADYTLIDNKTIVINKTIDLSVNDVIRVTMFTNDERLDIKTLVQQGLTEESVSTPVGFDDTGFDSVSFEAISVNLLATKKYTLATPVKNINYLWVTLEQNNSNGGRYLFPNSDYKLTEDGTQIELLNSIDIFEDTVVVITQFGENVQAPAVAFRIFKDLNDNFNYFRIGASAITELSRPLDITDTEIYVKNASILVEPLPDLAIPGVIMVGGERILYYARDLENNKLTQIRRGIDGTGAISTIPENTIIQDASFLQQIPNAHSKTWYDLGDGYPTNGLGLQYSTTEQAKFLLKDPALPISVVFDGKFMVPGYVINGYVLGNLY